MTDPSAQGAAQPELEDRAILSFSLLLSVLASGFVIALGQAVPNASLLNLFNILN